MRIPSALELSLAEWTSLRAIATQGFTPYRQVNHVHRKRLLELGLLQKTMGGLIASPAGRIVSRAR
jgi:hypothetical protein